MKNNLFSVFVVFSMFCVQISNATTHYTQRHLPKGARARLGKGELSAHPKSITFSPNGQQLAVASNIGVWIYDVETMQERMLLTDHASSVISVSFSPDGTVLASGTGDSVKLWNVATKENIATLEGYTASFSPDGTVLASGTGDSVKLWNVATKENIATLEGHTDGVMCLAFSPDGTLLAIGDRDGTVKLWELTTGRTATLIGDGDAVGSVAFSPDGAILISGEHRVIKLWDVTTRQNIFSFDNVPSGGQRQSVVFSPDGRTLAYISLSTVKLWDVVMKTHIAPLRVPGYNIFSVTFSPDGKMIAVGAYDKVSLWNIGTMEKIATLKGHKDSVTDIALSPNGTTLAAGSWDGVNLWNTTTRENIATFARSLVGVSSIAYSPDGKKLVTGEGHPVQVAQGVEDGTVDLWDVATQENLLTMKSHTNWVYSVAFSPDGNTIASGGGRFGDYSIRLWNAITGERLRTLTGHTNRVNSVSFSPDSKTLVSGSSDRTIRLWDVNTGQSKKILRGHTGGVYSVSFRPDGQMIASGGSNQGVTNVAIRLWDVNTGQSKKTLWKHTFHVNSVAFSPDGQMLASGGTEASGSMEGIIRLWDVDAGTLLHTFTGHTASVSSVSFSSDGQTLASGSADGTVLLWEVPSFGQQESKSAEVTTRPERDVSPDVNTRLPGQRVEVDSDRDVESRNIPPDRANLGRRNNTSNLDRLLSPSGGNAFMLDGKRRGLFLGIEAGGGMAAWKSKYYYGDFWYDYYEDSYDERYTSVDNNASPAFTMNFKIGYGSSEQTLFYMKGGLSTSGIIILGSSSNNFLVDLKGGLGVMYFPQEDSRFYYHGSLEYVLSAYREDNGGWYDPNPFGTPGVSGGIGYEFSPGFNLGVTLDYHRWDAEPQDWGEAEGERYNVWTLSVTVSAHLY